MFGTSITLLSLKKEPMFLNYVYEQISYQYEIPNLSLILEKARGDRKPWPSGRYRVSYLVPLSYDGPDEYLIRYKPGNDTTEECSINLVIDGKEDIRSLHFDFPHRSAKSTFHHVLTTIKEISYRRKTPPEFVCHGYKEGVESLSLITEDRIAALVFNVREQRYMHKHFELRGIEAFA